jgi:nickel-dependent lactate racemase
VGKIPLSDVEINQRLDKPIGSPVIDDVVSPNDSVLIVVPDATRQIACGQVVNLLIRRLIASGTAPANISIIFATGIHRAVTAEEKDLILTPFIAQRIKSLDHQPRDLAAIVRLGETKSGIPIELNRAATEYDRIILIGGIAFHYFAGFTGGRKLICPGLGSSKTINATHKLAFDCEALSRRRGVGLGLLEGNAVHEAFMEVTESVAPSFSVNTVVNAAGRIINLSCGNWVESHRMACDSYADEHAIEISEKRDVVIVSAGGFPHDINMIQAHKALESASKACVEGGTIVLVAECVDGTGRPDFLDWFDSEDSRALAVRLCERYQVNGQTAWSLFQKAERFDLKIISSLEASDTAKMRMGKIPSLPDFGRASGYIIPDGAKYLIRDKI